VLTPSIVIPRARRIVRRGIEIGCELYSERGGSRRERVLDLSHHGARVSTDVPLFRGEEVLLSFVVPGAFDDRVATMCRVVHAAGVPGPDDRAVGLSFVELTDVRRAEIERRLRGVPPPLPRRAPKCEMVWVDALVTWEEDLGDQVNTFEVAERFTALADDEIEIVTLSEPLSGGAQYRWIAA
jgi:hypothetical protein